MIMLNTQDARALLTWMDGKVPTTEQAQTLGVLHQKLKDHEWLIEQCEATAQRAGAPTPPEKEPA